MERLQDLKGKELDFVDRKKHADAHVFFVGITMYISSENLCMTLALYDGHRGKR